MNNTKTADNIQELFQKLNRTLGITILIVTHDMRLASRADRVLMIADGKISTEKVLKEEYKKSKDAVSQGSDLFSNTHMEYSVLDKAGRLQLSEEMLKEIGVSRNRVRVWVRDGEIIIKK